MHEWLTGIVGENMATGAMLIIVTLIIVIAFVLLLAVLRGFGPTGVRSNRRTRQTRLAVMDAAVIDSKRRLVLVRRDDVEHLVMIGGTSDVVIEQNIKRRQVSSSAQKTSSRTRPSQAPLRQGAARPPKNSEIPGHPASPSQQPASASIPQPAPYPQIRPAVVPPTPVATAKPDIPKAETAGSAGPMSPAVTSAAAASGALANQVKTTVSPPQKVELTLSPKAASPVVTSVTSPPSVTPRPKPEQTPNTPSTPTVEDEIPAATPPAPVLHAADKPAPTPSEAPLGESDRIPENQLTEFEDELAMNLGTQLVPKDQPARDYSLASEMDELLSEITAGSSSRK